MNNESLHAKQAREKGEREKDSLFKFLSKKCLTLQVNSSPDAMKKCELSAA
jgi:hypothetical protein